VQDDDVSVNVLLMEINRTIC